VGHDRTLVLIAVPRTLDAQTTGDVVQRAEGCGDLVAGHARDGTASGCYCAGAVVAVCVAGFGAFLQKSTT
jgi:hypothetical protein